MTANQMRRRRRRRAAAVDRCLLRYWRQVRIEEELDRLLSPSPLRQSPRGLSPFKTPSSSRRPGTRGRDPAGSEMKWRY